MDQTSLIVLVPFFARYFQTNIAEKVLKVKLIICKESIWWFLSDYDYFESLSSFLSSMYSKNEPQVFFDFFFNIAIIQTLYFSEKGFHYIEQFVIS